MGGVTPHVWRRNLVCCGTGFRCGTELLFAALGGSVPAPGHGGVPTHDGDGHWLRAQGARQARANAAVLFVCSYRTPRLVEPLQTDHEALEEGPCHRQSPLFGECRGLARVGGARAPGLPVSRLRVSVSKRPKITGRLIASTRCRRYVLERGGARWPRPSPGGHGVAPPAP